MSSTPLSVFSAEERGCHNVRGNKEGLLIRVKLSVYIDVIHCCAIRFIDEWVAATLRYTCVSDSTSHYRIGKDIADLGWILSRASGRVNIFFRAIYSASLANKAIDMTKVIRGYYLRVASLSKAVEVIICC